MSDDNNVEYKEFIRNVYKQTWEKEFIIEVEDRETLAARQAARCC